MGKLPQSSLHFNTIAFLSLGSMFYFYLKGTIMEMKLCLCIFFIWNISVLKWSTTQRVLKPCQGKMGVIYMNCMSCHKSHCPSFVCMYRYMFVLYCTHLVQLLIQYPFFMVRFPNKLFILKRVVIESMVVTEQFFYNSNFLGIMHY